MNKKIHLSLAKMSGEEKGFINKAFESNWVTQMGPNVNGFEKDLKTYFDNKNRNQPNTEQITCFFIFRQ